jgi:natural product precursor
MKKLKKLKLNVLSEANLREREMNRLTGGERICTCSCYYANSGGSSSSSNRNANYNIGSGGESGNGCNDYWLVDGIVDYCPQCYVYFQG